MKSVVNRFVTAGVVAVLLTAMSVFTAVAWSTTCSTSAQKICVYSNADFGVPMAAMNGSLASYGTDKYPNTNLFINDTVSSVKNLYSTRDVIFKHDVGPGGGSLCVDSGAWYTYVGFWDNDRFSAHALTADDNAC